MPGLQYTEERAPFAFETITVSSTALGFTTATAFPTGLPPADAAFVSVETDSIRYRVDGLNPTDTVGHLVASGGSFWVYGTLNCRKLRMIRVTNDATIRVTYYRRGDA